MEPEHPAVRLQGRSAKIPGGLLTLDLNPACARWGAVIVAGARLISQPHTCPTAPRLWCSIRHAAADLRGTEPNALGAVVLAGVPAALPPALPRARQGLGRRFPGA